MKEFNKKHKKKTNEFGLWDIIKARNNDSIRVKNTEARKPTNMKEEFSKGVLSKLHKQPASLNKRFSAF